jgi:thiamine biosynthesis lipoprotein
MRRIDAIFSLWKPDSAMSALRGGRLDPAQAPPAVETVAALCREAKEASGGWFDPWALPGGYDPTGLVKGWAAEQALGSLVVPGVMGAMVNAGGDLAVSGTPSEGRWRIGIDHPWHPDALAGVVEIEGAIATAGTYRRGPHLVDPRGAPWRGRVVSATVTGPSLAMADALSTALAVAGEQGLSMLASIGGYEGYLVLSNGSEYRSEGFLFAEPGATSRAR